MTINEAINLIDSRRPNSYTTADKIMWLSITDGYIKSEIIDKYKGNENVIFNGYNADTPLDTVLLVPEPYSELYVYALESKINYFNNEFDLFNASGSMFNEIKASFRNYYNSTHEAKTQHLSY